MSEYLYRLFLAQQNPAFPTGGIGSVDVSHDKKCQIYAGNPCNCDPLITISHNGKLLYVGESGKISMANPH